MPGHPVPRFALRACPVRERRSALQARHPARQPMADCPGAVRYAPEVAACQLLPAGVEVCRRQPAVPEEVQPESAPPLRAAASGRARPSLAADPVQHPPAAMACRRAQPSARRAQARLQPVASAQLAVSQPRAASWCAAVPGASPDEAAEAVRQPEAPAVAEEPQRGAEAVRDGVAAGRQPAAAWAAAGVQRRAVAAVQDVAAGLQPAAAPGVRQREAPDVPAAAQPSAAPSVCRRDQLPPWPGQPRSAHPALGMRGLRIALQ
jgi:hypothetical protein